MWIYPTSLSAQASDSSTSLSPEYSEVLAQSLWWRGKPSASSTWRRRWKRESWLRRLSARMCESYEEATSLMSISSSVASPVNPTVKPANGGDTETRETSSMSSSVSLASWNPPSSSWRTSRGLWGLEDSEDFSGRWPTSGSMLSGELFEQATLERPIEGGESSFWPTATAGDSKSSGASGYSTDSGRHSGTTLTDSARQWATPDATVSNDGEGLETFEARRARVKAKGINGNGMGTPLAMQCKQWATPTTRDHKDGSDMTTPVNGYLGRQVLRATGVESPKKPYRLNPSFVEWLMGAPSGWINFEH